MDTTITSAELTTMSADEIIARLGWVPKSAEKTVAPPARRNRANAPQATAVVFDAASLSSMDSDAIFAALRA